MEKRPKIRLFDRFPAADCAGPKTKIKTKIPQTAGFGEIIMKTKTIFQWFVPTPRNRYQPYALRKKALTFYVTVLFIFKASVGIFVFAYPQPAFYASANVEEILRLTNEERAKVGVAPLSLNPLLNQSALLKTNDMFSQQYFAHVSPQGVEPWYWFDHTGYHYTYAGENLAIGFETSEGVHQAWMNSAGHRDNILNPNYKEIGIAVVYGQFEGNYTTLITQHFGSLENTPYTEIPAPATEPAATPVPPAPTPATPTAPSTPAPDLTAPAPPQFLEPKNFLVTKNSQPTITGIAEAGATVFLYTEESKINETKANPQNRFSFTLKSPLSDGANTFRAAAVDANGNWSAFSQNLTITIDTQAPNIDLDHSYALPSYLEPRKNFDVFAYVTGVPVEVRASSGNIEVTLEKREGNLYYGVIEQSTNGIWLKAKDQAGNVASEQLSSIKELKIAPQSKRAIPLKTENNLALFAESLDQAITKLIFLFSGAICVLLLINVFVHIRKQNGNLIFSVLLALCASALLLLF